MRGSVPRTNVDDAGDAALVATLPSPPRWQRRWYGVFGAVAMVASAVAAAAAGLIFLVEQIDGDLSVAAFEDVIRSWGHWGVVVSIGLMVLHSFVPFPAELVALANGMLYGPLWGTVVTWLGAMLGAFLSFGLSRAFGRPLVERLVARRNWRTLDEWTGRHAAEMVFFARFLPIISFNLVNYAAGLAKISWWTFAWTTGVGILPVTTLFVVLGHQVDKLAWYWWAALVAAAGLGWLAFLRWRSARTGDVASVAARETGHAERAEVRKAWPRIRRV